MHAEIIFKNRLKGDLYTAFFCLLHKGGKKVVVVFKGSFGGIFEVFKVELVTVNDHVFTAGIGGCSIRFDICSFTGFFQVYRNMGEWD